MYSLYTINLRTAAVWLFESRCISLATTLLEQQSAQLIKVKERNIQPTYYIYILIYILKIKQ